MRDSAWLERTEVTLYWEDDLCAGLLQNAQRQETKLVGVAYATESSEAPECVLPAQCLKQTEVLPETVTFPLPRVTVSRTGLGYYYVLYGPQETEVPML